MKKKGRGIAAALYSMTVTNAPNPASAHVQMREDGSVNIQTGAVDVGQGSNTVLSIMASEALGVPVERVSIYHADSSATPHDFGCVSSRLTFAAGRAVLAACDQVKEILFDVASKELKCRVNSLEIRDGLIVDRYDPKKCLPVPAAAALSQFKHRKLPMGAASFYPFNVPVDENSQGEPSDNMYYQATIVEVEVDTETGIVEVKKLYSAVDCGFAINPLAVEGQVEGGALQGMGFGLTEDMYPYATGAETEYDDFNPDFKTTNLSDYAIPTIMDMPETLVGTYVESHEPEGPFGAKATGEIAANTAAPAIVNAIHDAVGIWITDLPATPEKILKALAEKKEKQEVNNYE